ncbi:WhiB family transcriptional regulator [Mycolicibacter senuensis]|nr:WhiB family transcriptional regulator [Mycolicibacter senuensis]
MRELSVNVRDTLDGGIALDVRIAPQTVIELIDTYRLTATPRVLAALAEKARNSWQEQALCHQSDPEMFFPEKGGATSAAKRICRACPVRQECLNHALDNDERFGIWGGLSERERRKLRPGHTVDAAPAQLPVRRVG